MDTGRPLYPRTGPSVLVDHPGNASLYRNQLALGGVVPIEARCCRLPANSPPSIWDKKSLRERESGHITGSASPH